MTIPVTTGTLNQGPTVIPVRGPDGKKLPPEMIRYFVHAAMDHARRNPSENFKVVFKGYPYPPAVIGPMFDYCPSNIFLPGELV